MRPLRHAGGPGPRRTGPWNDGLPGGGRAVLRRADGGETVRRLGLAAAAGLLDHRRARLRGLAKRAQPRLLVEKSPSIAWSVEAMRRTRLVPRRRFVPPPPSQGPRRVRPAALTVMRSRRTGFRARLAVLPWLVSGARRPNRARSQARRCPAAAGSTQWAWYALNRNIADFLEGMPPAVLPGARRGRAGRPGRRACRRWRPGWACVTTPKPSKR